MNFCSYFIQDKALFGSFPTINSANELYSNNVNIFVDLTTDKEKTTLDKYYEELQNITYINYPIDDRKIPTDIKSFSIFIIRLKYIINSLTNNKIYIHCRGGHGRSGIVVACLLCILYKITPEQALDMTTRFHSNRPEMRDKWRTIGSPQTGKQKGFVIKICKPLYFFKAYRSGYTLGLSNFSRHPIQITNLETFPTSISAYYSYKNKNDKEYVEKLKNAETPQFARTIGLRYGNPENWNNIRYDIMKNIIELKITQHPEILENLLTNTGIRPIIYTSKYEDFWGIGEHLDGKNNLGKIWEMIRETEYYKLI